MPNEISCAFAFKRKAPCRAWSVVHPNQALCSWNSFYLTQWSKCRQKCLWTSPFTLGKGLGSKLACIYNYVYYVFKLKKKLKQKGLKGKEGVAMTAAVAWLPTLLFANNKPIPSMQTWSKPPWPDFRSCTGNSPPSSGPAMSITNSCQFPRGYFFSLFFFSYALFFCAGNLR